MRGRLLTFSLCKPFLEGRTSLFCFQIVLSTEGSQNLLWNFATWFLYMLCRFPLSTFTMHSQTILDENKRKHTCVCGKNIGKHGEWRDFAWSSSKDFKRFDCPWYKNLMGRIHCLCDKIFYRLYAVPKEWKKS